jgi:Uma2 family endonuclease
MSSASVQRRYTPEEYLALERAAEFKSEYRDGVIVGMSGATREHNLITGNVFAEIRQELRGRPCEVYTGEMRVWVSNSGVYVYPDVVAVCGKPQFQDNVFDSLLNPSVVVEVSSKSTASYDRREKFDAYRRLPSLREYVIVAQDQVRVECFSLVGDTWTIAIKTKPEETLLLGSINCELPLSAIYERVQFPPDDSPSQSRPGPTSP